MPVLPGGLDWRQRASLAAHLFKAVAWRHHLELEPLLRELVPPGGVVLDIGAHAGQFTKLFARLARDGRVHAVEPGGYARFILAATVRTLGLANVTIHALALSDRDGEAELVVPIKAAGGVGFGLGHLAGAHDVLPVRRERVQVSTLDRLVARLGLARLDLIKADIEGGEAAMLAGARATLARFRPALLIEIDSARLERAGSDVNAVWAPLEALGYQGRRVAADGALAARPGDLGDGDYLFRVAGVG